MGCSSILHICVWHSFQTLPQCRTKTLPLWPNKSTSQRLHPAKCQRSHWCVLCWMLDVSQERHWNCKCLWGFLCFSLDSALLYHNWFFYHLFYSWTLVSFIKNDMENVLNSFDDFVVNVGLTMEEKILRLLDKLLDKRKFRFICHSITSLALGEEWKCYLGDRK